MPWDVVDALNVIGAYVSGVIFCVIDALVIIDVLGASGGVICVLGDLGATVVDVLSASDVLGVVAVF